MVEELGSGPLLDQSFDFQIDTTGDIDSTSGSAELQKDLSFQLVLLLDQYIGQPLDPDTRADIKSTTVDAVTSDVRIESIDRGSLAVSRPTPDQISIRATVRASGEEQELVFTI